MWDLWRDLNYVAEKKGKNISHKMNGILFGIRSFTYCWTRWERNQKYEKLCIFNKRNTPVFVRYVIGMHVLSFLFYFIFWTMIKLMWMIFVLEQGEDIEIIIFLFFISCQKFVFRLFDHITFWSDEIQINQMNDLIYLSKLR